MWNTSSLNWDTYYMFHFNYHWVYCAESNRAANLNLLHLLHGWFLPWHQVQLVGASDLGTATDCARIRTKPLKHLDHVEELFCQLSKFCDGGPLSATRTGACLVQEGSLRKPRPSQIFLPRRGRPAKTPVSPGHWTQTASEEQSQAIRPLLGAP